MQIGPYNPFGKIPVDQTKEETLNRDTRTPGGTKGFSLKPSAVMKNYLSAEYRSKALEQSRQMRQSPSPSTLHADLGSSRKVTDEYTATAVIGLLEKSWINPSQNHSRQLVNMSSAHVASAEITESLLDAYREGKKLTETLQKNDCIVILHNKSLMKDCAR